MAIPAAREPGPLVILLRFRTVAKVDSIVILSRSSIHLPELGFRVVDGVVDVLADGRWWWVQQGPIVIGSRRVRGGVSRSWPRAWASWRRSCWFSSASSRLRRSAMSRRWRSESSLARCRAGVGGGVLGLVAGAQAPDLVFEVGLGVEPGSGDSGVIGDGFEGDLGPGAVEFVQGGDSFGAGEFVPLFRRRW